MLSKELLNKIRAIEIKTRRLLNGVLVGDFTTAQKGSGFEFDQLREYQEGDDVRFIDWKSSARGNKLMVRQYLEERSRTIWLLVDRSPSTWYGSKNMLKYEVIAEAASILALVAEYGKDMIGLLTFGEEKFILPPKRGHAQTMAIMRYLLDTKAPPPTTSTLTLALKHIAQITKKKSIIIILSDFINYSEADSKHLIQLTRRHEVIALRCRDKRELNLPEGALLEIQDPETKELLTLQTSQINRLLSNYWNQQDQLFKKSPVALLDISTEGSFIEDLIRFFRRYMMY